MEKGSGPRGVMVTPTLNARSFRHHFDSFNCLICMCRTVVPTSESGGEGTWSERCDGNTDIECLVL